MESGGTFSVIKRLQCQWLYHTFSVIIKVSKLTCTRAVYQKNERYVKCLTGLRWQTSTGPTS